MSSRLFRPQDAIAAPPIVWPQATGPAARPMRPRTFESRGGAEGDAEARIEAAYQQGQAAGEAAGAQRAAQRLDPVFAGLNSVIQELSAIRPRLRLEAEEDTVRLAVAIARRVLHRELATDPEAILGLVKAAFSRLNARETNRLRVSPADAAVIQESRARRELPDNLEIHPDASLPQGSAIFETSRGDLDASVDTQLAEIDRGLADVMRRQSR
jgi:flagellar assembly protein FliH